MKWEQLVRKNGKTLDALGIDLRGINTVKFGALETLSHRVTKLIICHLLEKSGHAFKTEQPINEAVCDVIDLDTFVVYEVESYANSTVMKKKLDDFRHPLIEDLITLDLGRMKLDWEPVYDTKDAIRKFCGLHY